jgi:hypothetical protein
MGIRIHRNHDHLSHKKVEEKDGQQSQGMCLPKGTKRDPFIKIGASRRVMSIISCPCNDARDDCRSCRPGAGGVVPLGEEPSSSWSALVASVSSITASSSDKTDDESLFSHSSESSERRVVFRQEVHCKLIPSAKDLDEAERHEIWMTADAFSKIARNCAKIVRMMDMNNKYCSRGLESRTRQGVISKNLNRMKAIRTVLSEQSRGSSPELIARAYHAASSSSQIWACVVALKDQRTAESYI